MTAPKTDMPSSAAAASRGSGVALAGRTCIVAGGGTLPVEVADALDMAGTPPFVLMVEGEADPVLARHEGMTLPLGAMPAQLGTLKKKNIRNIVLAGSIRSRPMLRSLRFDRHVVGTIPRLLASVFALRHGDDRLLRSVVQLLGENGIRVVGAHEILPDLLAPYGPLGRHKPGKPGEADIGRAWQAAKAIGALDVGQGAVAVRGRVVALEGAEGTDAMLDRVRRLREEGRIPKKRGGVLVKCAKPNQELRADLPAIGPPTVANAVAAGLDGIVVETGRALIMEQARTVELADDAGLFIAGRREDDFARP